MSYSLPQRSVPMRREHLLVSTIHMSAEESYDGSPFRAMKLSSDDGRMVPIQALQRE